MIIVSCPLRVSLVGGSTDHPNFIEKYKKGSVISFPSNLKVFVTLHQDKVGKNSVDDEYVINYSIQERSKNINDIKNELVKNCFKHFNIDKINCSLTSDVYSIGTGLASSSAYLLALIKGISLFQRLNLSDFEICEIAKHIEKKFNPLVGQQDFYGSLDGFKRINFFQNKTPEIKYLSNKMFDFIDCFLLYSGVKRNSTEILEKIDVDKSLVLLDDVNDLEKAIDNLDILKFNDIIKRGWINKKLTSNIICSNEKLIEIDNKLSSDKRILSHKLCGAGNGGFFLIFCEKNFSEILKHDYNNIIQINLSNGGLKHEVLL